MKKEHSRSRLSNYAEGKDTSSSVDLREATPTQETATSTHTSWLNTLKNILPIYIALHIAFFLLTYLSTFFTLGNFSTTALRLNTLLHVWYRWDSGHFTFIATRGYDMPYRTAFFPLFPLLERELLLVTRDPFVAGLIISNIAGLAMLVVLYHLVVEDFDVDRAYRAVLYFSVF